MMKKKEMKLLDDFVKECKKKFRRNLVSIILFGSRATGKANEGSDWDILVVLKKLPKNKHQIEFELRKVEEKYHQVIQPFLISMTDIKKTPINPLIYGILTGYDVLYGEQVWKDLIISWRPFIKRTRPEYIDEEKTWKIARLI
ncbi:MAG: nucleotidyltransferase domain-containing protein [Candidatus Aenigmarchaeota archaeon]|nr:nucleotidyltransferase domain-containing protein [Candidatus Aenigmarchaeota archaeon]